MQKNVKLIICLFVLVLMSSVIVAKIIPTTNNNTNNIEQNSLLNPNKPNNPNACTSDCNFTDSVDYEINELPLDLIPTIFEDQKDAIIFIGFESCPWCKDLTPIFKDVIHDQKLDDITYYLNVRPDGKKDNDLRYSDNQLYKTLYDAVFDLLTDDKILYAPTIAYINDGVVQSLHVGTLTDHDATKTSMSEEQICQLTNDLLKELEMAKLIEC